LIARSYAQEHHDSPLRTILGYCRQRTTDEFLTEIAGMRQRPAQ